MWLYIMLLYVVIMYCGICCEIVWLYAANCVVIMYGIVVLRDVLEVCVMHDVYDGV